MLIDSASWTNSQLQEQNLADKIYTIFKFKGRTVLKRNDLIKTYKKQYDRPLIMMELRELPFIRFESNDTVICLVIELDDICTKCKWARCRLLHCVSPSDKFKQIYHSNSNQEKQQKFGPLRRPKIRLIQRLKSILTKSESVTLSELRKRHNAKFSQFESHEPTSTGIAIRFKSTFLVQFDENANDYVITFQSKKV